ncbi:MAG: phage holin family protein [Chloroflexota bacterium]
MRRALDFYRLQIQVMRTWRPGGRSRLRRILATFVVSILSFMGAVLVTPGYDIVPGNSLLIAAFDIALFLALVNLFVRPLFLALFAGISVIAVAIATLLFQVATFLAIPYYEPEIAAKGFASAIIASFIYGFVNITLTSLFSISDDDSYWQVLLQQLAARRSGVIHSTTPGMVVVQIDGLAKPILQRQVRAGRVPHLAGWLRTGKHRLDGWEALLPPTTPASQAGILHGNNNGIPAFRWYEKEHGRLMVANKPDDAFEVAGRISNGEGLLSNNGASVGNLFSGDAARSYISMATIKDKSQGLGKSQTFLSFFASPSNYLSTIVRSIAEVFKEYVQARRQARAGIVPRMHRGMPYPVARAATNVALRDLSTALVIEEMYRGTPIIYVDYTDYDEIAHHSGPERSETFDALDGVDRAIATLAKAALAAPRPYQFVIVSDHGQTLGATFLQRYGKTLGDVVRGLMGDDARLAESGGRAEEFGQTNAFLSELTQSSGVSGRLARRALRSQAVDGVVDLQIGGAARASVAEAAALARDDAGRPDLIAIASGNLGLVYFPQMPGRVTLEQLAERYPRMVDALVAHQGIGAMLVRTESHGSIVVGRDGINYLAENRVVGVDPVAQYGGRSREAFLRLDGLDHVPDLSIVSLYDPEFDEVAAFEELIGSHGGLGGAQTQPMLMHPSEWDLDEEIVGAEAVYRQLRRWAERHLDHRFGKDGTAPPLPMPERQAKGDTAA